MQGWLELEVRYSETDPMQVAHHSSYWIWFEMARIAMLDAAGVHYSFLESKGVFLPVLKAKIEYLRSLRFGEKIGIETLGQRMGLSRLVFEYQVFLLPHPRFHPNLEQKILTTTASTEHVFVNSTGKPLRFPAQFSDFFPKK